MPEVIVKRGIVGNRLVWIKMCSNCWYKVNRCKNCGKEVLGKIICNGSDGHLCEECGGSEE